MVRRGRPVRPARAGLVAAGVLGGFFSGLVGVGGGIVMVPILTGLVGLRQHLAHGTSLAVIVFAAVSGGAVYWIRGDTDWGATGLVSVGSVVGATFGAHAMARIPAPELKLVFALFVLGTSLRMIVA